MKSKIIIAVFALASVALAQHGGGAHGGGGVAAGGMGAGRPDVGMSNAGARGASDQMATMSGPRTPSELLSQNTKLSSNLDKLLPQGMTSQQACNGFKNLGECVSAIHVSHNLGIPFSALKGKMTGSGSESLGKAIQSLKPDADAKAEAKKAKGQAKEDLKNNS